MADSEWTAPSQIDPSLLPPSPSTPGPSSSSKPFFLNHLPFPSASNSHASSSANRRTSFPGFAGPTVAPLTHKTSTRNAAITETFRAFVRDSGERTWWTVSDLARGELPWWRLERKRRQERRAAGGKDGRRHVGDGLRPPAGVAVATVAGDQLTARPLDDERDEKSGKGKRPLRSIGLHRRCRSDETTTSIPSASEPARPRTSTSAYRPKGIINVTVPSRYPGYDTLSPSSPVLMLGGFRGSTLETVVETSRSRRLSEVDAPQDVENGVSGRSSSSSSRSDLSTHSAPETASPRHAALEAFPVPETSGDEPTEKRGTLYNLFKDGSVVFGNPFPNFTLPSIKDYNNSKDKDKDKDLSSGIATPQKVWPNMSAAMFNPGHPDLAMLLVSDLDASEEDQEVARAANGLRARAMTNTIGGLVNMGWSLRRRLERMERDGRIGSLERWGFDFRASLARSSRLLIAKVTALRAASKTREGVTIFAHSMGGLVVAHAVATCEDPTVFKRIVYFGTPWLGCAGIMGPLRTGDGFLRQEAICDAVTSTCASPSLLWTRRS